MPAIMSEQTSENKPWPTSVKVKHPARFVRHRKTHITRLISGWDAWGKYHLDIG